MADLADWTNDCLQEANPEWFPAYRFQRPAASGSHSTNVVCSVCGAQGLSWRFDGRKWKLSSYHGGFHKCDMQRAALSDFEDIS